MASRGMISIESKGNMRHMRSFFKRTRQQNFKKYLEYFGELGLQLLIEDTPIDTGRAALSWGYEIEQGDGYMSLTWTNSDIENGANVILLIEYGHGTRGGAYVQPYPFVKPITEEIFSEMAETIWKEVTRE